MEISDLVFGHSFWGKTTCDLRDCLVDIDYHSCTLSFLNHESNASFPIPYVYLMISALLVISVMGVVLLNFAHGYHIQLSKKLDCLKHCWGFHYQINFLGRCFEYPKELSLLCDSYQRNIILSHPFTFREMEGQLASKTARISDASFLFYWISHWYMLRKEHWHNYY